MKSYWLPILLITLLLMTACNSQADETPTPIPATHTPLPAPSATPAPSGETVRGQATIDSIQVEMLESFPIQVNVIARGELPDSCTQIDEIVQQRNDTTFRIIITTIRPGDAVCTADVVPFSETIPLDVEGLDAGTYDVNAGDPSGTFTLAADNRIEEVVPEPEPSVTPEPPAADSNSAAISGLVWHDLCAVTGGEGEAEATPSPGCVVLENGGVQANGLLEEGEPGLANVIVSLGEGACPSTGFAEATTNADGEYTFTDLPAGEYCVSVDVTNVENTAVLDPGSFTNPETGVTAVTLSDGQTTSDINFGWDYEFLPVPEVDAATCTNNFEFVEDLSIDDDTIMAPGTEFVKEWRLRNIGTCPWTTDYTFVTVDEAPLPFGGDTEVPLESVVAPGQTMDIAATLIAPTTPGTYRSNWQLADANGERFGVGGFIEDAVYVRIVVDENADVTPEPNTAVIGGVVWADYCAIQNDGSPSVGCLETAEGSGVYIANGTYNFYESPIPELLVTLSDGACPEEGVITPSSILSTTTTDVDGLYRFTGLDNGTYCISIDAFDDTNINSLIPGDWTYPYRGVGRLGVILQAGEERLDVDFGWDYQFD
ncbi:MAG: hypothetical protein H6662_18180 [Ardenticatenaceae bacterium]|nr:hypothetical protein [Ardenticatenaceae bacterium]MCB8991910.1 hypothetical protein [Ardenticatenaceae bacterium]MCB9003756.1 hypothetical protein [Ardenticatenaceae bacterium]